MNHDAFIRAAAVVAAAALLAAPYRHHIAQWISQAAEAASRHVPAITRAGAAALLIAAGWGVVPLPTLPRRAVETITVETPSVEMQAKVAAVASAMANANPAERAIWANVWEKAALVVSSPEGQEAVFTDTRSLRGFTVLSLDIAWRRLAGKVPGEFPGLRAAVERVMGDAVGLDVQPVTPDVRRRYAEACKAIAWAGVGKG